MTPDRTQSVNGHLVTEYYWAGRMVVYVDGIAYSGSFEQAVAELSTKQRKSEPRAEGREVKEHG